MWVGSEWELMHRFYPGVGPLLDAELDLIYEYVHKLFVVVISHLVFWTFFFSHLSSFCGLLLLLLLLLFFLLSL